MTSSRTKKLAKALQEEHGVNYTTALRMAHAQFKKENLIRDGVVEPSATPTTETDNASPLPPWSRFRHSFEDLHVDLKLRFGTGENESSTGLDLRESKNFLCTGATGSGKTNLLQNLVFSSLMLDAFYEVSIVTTGPSLGFSFARPYARAVTTGLAEASALINTVLDEAIVRNEIREMYGADSFSSLPEEVWKKEDLHIEHQILVIDDLDDLLRLEPAHEDTVADNELRVEIGEALSEIIRLGQYAGVSIVSSAHSRSMEMPIVKDISDRSAHVLLGRTTHHKLIPSWIDGDELPSLGTTIPPGRGVYASPTGGVKAVQVWIEPGGSDTFADHLREAIGYDWSKSRKINIKPRGK